MDEPRLHKTRSTNIRRRSNKRHRDAIETKAQNKSEAKAEQTEQTAPAVENKSEAKAEQTEQTAPAVENKSEAKAEQTEQTAPAVENKSEAKAEQTEQNQSEVDNRSKAGPELQLSVTRPPAGLNNSSSAAKGTSDHRALDVLPDASEDGNQSVERPMNEKITEWVMLITSVLLEAMSAVFDQVGYAFMGMVIAFLALFLSSLHLIWKARKEGVKRSQPSGGRLDYYGLAAAFWQCFYSTMEYLYTRKNHRNPIKICLLPFIFALFLLLYCLFKCRT